MRLLTVSNFFDSHRGGLEIVAGRLARELAGRGFEVTWLASDTTPSPADPALRCVPARVWNIAEERLGVPWPVLSPGSIARLWREVKDADAVLLHDALYMASVVTFLAAKAHRRPLVIIQHIGQIPYRHPFLRGLMELANRIVAAPVLSGADQVVFISEFVRSFFGGLKFRSPPRLVFNGVDTEVFRPACGERRAAARARFGLTVPTALFVGRFVEKKGVEILRRAAARRPDVTFAFAGWGVIEPAAWDLPNVRVFSDLAGAGLAELYRASDVFVLPSQGEGFPLVVQEALACGLPVVCGAESTRADAEAGAWLVGVPVEGDVDQDHAAADVLAAMDRALAANAPGAAQARYEFVRRRYAWSAAADRYAEIIRGLIEPAPGAAVLEPA
ncbi:MAG TPA: glycosyltransferase family 4 protein [Caulobacteraceae bacterium]|nr:glycosyltransferase family 4 protein [Caulobacteraceae bacterium]